MDDNALRARFAKMDERFDAIEKRFQDMMDAMANTSRVVEPRVDEHVKQVEKGLAGLGRRLDAMNQLLEDEFLGLKERSATDRLVRDQIERRVTDRLDVMRGDVDSVRWSVTRLEAAFARLGARIGGIERESRGTNSRLDALSTDVRRKILEQEIGRTPVRTGRPAADLIREVRRAEESL